MTDSVDLSGKEGVVDPKDTKKDDPKPPKVEGSAPPKPNSEDNDEHYTVHNTGEGYGGVPTSGSFPTKPEKATRSKKNT